MLTRNLWTEAGLCNGTMGAIKDIIFSENHNSPMLPIAIIVQFHSNHIGPSFCEDTPNCVPICPVTNSSTSLGNNLQRIQFPLKLAWSMTIHRSQGLTLDKCWIDLGTSERVAGLTYVALSRVCKISDPIIEPVTFDRLHSLKKNVKLQIQTFGRSQVRKMSTRYLTQTLRPPTLKIRWLIFCSHILQLKMENYQSPKKRMKYGMSSPPTSPPSSSSASKYQ